MSLNDFDSLLKFVDFYLKLQLSHVIMDESINHAVQCMNKRVEVLLKPQLALRIVMKVASVLTV